MPKHGSPKRVLIIGAGPTGLGAAWRLHELGGTPFQVFEREDHVGGLASSYTDPSGFVWDVGGHVLHSHYPYFDRMFESVMGQDYVTHERESWVWIFDRFVPYPFQNNIHKLPESVMIECLRGLKNRTGPRALRSFHDWMLASFGEGITRHFLYPYNEKVWAYPPERMNYAWVGDRVATIDIHRIEKNIRDRTDDVSWGPNAVFHFPKRGGTGNIWERVADAFRDRVSLNKTVTSIDAPERIVRFSDGSREAYDAVLTSMPLDVLTRITRGVRLPAPAPLHYSRVTVVGLGIRGAAPEHLKTKCWIYYPEQAAPFFRATVFSNYSEFNAPPGTWSLMTETASSAYRALPPGDIAQAVIEGAKRVRLLPDTATLESVWTFTTDHGYPTPTLGRDRYVDSVLPEFEKFGIYSRGRFGAWKYEVSNQDHTFMQGVEWADRMVNGTDEVTVFHPALVNRR